MQAGADMANFRINGMSAGIDHADRFRDEKSMQAEVERMRINGAYEKLMPEFRKFMGDSPKGGAIQVPLDGELVTSSSVEFALMLQDIAPYIKKFGIVVEIGGGYGGLARAVRMYEPSVAYTLVDFLPMLKMQYYFLGMRFVYKQQGYDPKREVDLFINTRSMMEMDTRELKSYFTIIESRLVKGGIFFHINRDKATKMKDWPMDDKWDCLVKRQWCYPPNTPMVEHIYRRL